MAVVWRCTRDCDELVDFQTKLTELATAPKPKVDPAVAQALSTEAQRVIDCINAIETPSP